ncbi:MAG: SulP family inorganic anion transporter, partial [Sulfurimonas sp.]
PSPLVTIVAITLVVIVFGIDVRSVGDMGELPDTLPIFLIPQIPFNFETLMIILPYSVSLAIVGLLESLMTATIVDDLTDTKSDKNRECSGQGMANIASGFMGGMAGCAMIGQSVINIKSGGRTRLSTLLAGLFLLIMVVFLSDLISIIPMAALVAVMIMVSIGTFDWGSIKKLKTLPISTNVVMIATVIVVVWTHNLALGVFVGVLLASLFFANKISHFMYNETLYNEVTDTREYKIVGQVFFNSAERFVEFFDFKEVVQNIIIDLTRAHFWDISAVYALDKVVIKLRREGANVTLIGQNEASSTIIDRFGIHDKPGEIEKVMGGH